MPNITPLTAVPTIAALIEQRLVAQWVDGIAPLTPIAWPFLHFDKPTNAPWLKFDRIGGPSFRAGVAGQGKGMANKTGTIHIQVYVPNNQGSGALDTLISKARAIFSEFDGGGINCQSSSDPRYSIEDGWAVATIDTPYFYFEFYEV